MGNTDHLQTGDLVSDYNNGEGASSLARRHKVSVWSILTRLRKAGVEIRKNQNERVLGTPTTDEYTFGEIVEGLLLGDGGIDKKGLLHIDQCLRREGWLLEIQSRFRLTGGDAKIIPTKPRSRMLEGREIKTGYGRHLYTPAYTHIQDQRRRWYPEGVKIVPQDIRLTPMVAAQWFCGDGTGGKSSTLTLYTNSFTEADVDLLVACMRRDLGVRASKGRSHHPGQFVVQVLSRRDALRFKSLVDPYIPDCCQYKLQHVRPGKFSILYPEEVEDIRRQAAAGENLKSLASDFDKSIGTIRNVIRGATHRV